MTKRAGQESLTSSVGGLQSVVVSKMHIQRHTTVHHFTRTRYLLVSLGLHRKQTIHHHQHHYHHKHYRILLYIRSFPVSSFTLFVNHVIYILFTDITITNENDMKITINKKYAINRCIYLSIERSKKYDD